MAQVVVRLDDDLTSALDALVADGAASSRSDAVRRGLERLIDDHRREKIGRAIVEGYERMPPGEDEGGWPDAATVAMIADEPW